MTIPGCTLLWGPRLVDCGFAQMNCELTIGAPTSVDLAKGEEDL